MDSFAAATLVQDIKTNNSLLTALDVKPTDRVIAVRENGLADANFILTNLMKQIFIEQNSKVCLVIMHNTLGHYQNVAKRLGYDLLKKIQSGDVIIIEPLKTIVDNIGCNSESVFLTRNKESIVKNLFLNINSKIEDLLKLQNEGHVHLIIDDISHLLDLGVDFKYIVTFLNYCVNLVTNDRISVMINCHVANALDEIVSNALSYAADLRIEVSPLKTGISHEVTGVITVCRKEQNMERSTKQSVYHYQAHDREIKTFAPGESLYRLYK